MSSNRSVPTIFQPRMHTQCSAFLDKMDGMYYFNDSSLSQFGRCERIKVLFLRIVSVLGAFLATARDLKAWFYSTCEVVRLSGLKFHLANLISILAFPFIAMATMPFGSLPISSYAMTLKGQAKLLDAFAHDSQQGTLTVENATKTLNRMIRCGVTLPSDFFLEAAKKGHTEVVTAFSNRSSFQRGYDEIRRAIHHSLTDKTSAEKLVSFLTNSVDPQFPNAVPISIQAMNESMVALDEEAVDLWLDMGMGPYRYVKAPFVCLILGGEIDLPDYPGKKCPRTAEKVIAIAKKCIVRYGAFYKIDFDQLIQFKNNYAEWTKYLHEGTLRHTSSFLHVLKDSRFMEAYRNNQNFAQIGAEFAKRITELEPYADEMQALQISSHLTRHNDVMETCRVLPSTMVKLVLQYCLEYTYAGADAIEDDSKEAIQAAQKPSLDAMAKEDLAMQDRMLTSLDPQQKEFSGRRLMVRYVQTLNPDGIEMVIKHGIDPCSTNPRNEKARITPFEHLLLGVEDLSKYPMRKTPRNIDIVVTIAKRCIECSGAFSREHFNYLLLIKQYPNVNMDNIPPGTGKKNPYCRLLEHTKIFTEPSEKVLSEVLKRINEIEPRLMELQVHQIKTYADKYKLVQQVCADIPGNHIKLILQYALRYSAAGEEYVRREEVALFLENQKQINRLMAQVIPHLSVPRAGEQVTTFNTSGFVPIGALTRTSTRNALNPSWH